LQFVEAAFCVAIAAAEHQTMTAILKHLQVFQRQCYEREPMYDCVPPHIINRMVVNSNMRNSTVVVVVVVVVPSSSVSPNGQTDGFSFSPKPMRFAS
jgi:hypothetical protein